MSGGLDPAPTTTREIKRVAAGLVARASAISTATLHEAAGRTGDLPHTIKPACAGFRIAGPAVTVACPNGDNLWLHRALYAAEPGDVLVVQPGEGPAFGYWGEVMSTAAMARKLAGLVIVGGVRDAPLLRELGFPVFARELCIRGTIKDLDARGWINAPLLIERTVVNPGDLIVGDEDGVVAIARGDAERVIVAAKARDEREAGWCDKLRAGATTMELLGLDR